MPEKSKGSPRFMLTTRRIEALADCIFAFAMTLLVLTLTLPDVMQTKLSLSQLLVAQWPKFFNYALSFLLLAVFWVIHHQQFHVIRRTDSRHVWINVGILMFVALMPFSTDVVGDYGGENQDHYVGDPIGGQRPVAVETAHRDSLLFDSRKEHANDLEDVAGDDPEESDEHKPRQRVDERCPDGLERVEYNAHHSFRQGPRPREESQHDVQGKIRDQEYPPHPHRGEETTNQRTERLGLSHSAGHCPKPRDPCIEVAPDPSPKASIQAIRQPKE